MIAHGPRQGDGLKTLNGNDEQASFDSKHLTLSEHLDELRSRIIICLVVLTIFTLLAYTQRDLLVKVITRPYFQVSKHQLLVLGPAEAFLAKIKMSLVAGGVLGFPVILYQAWAFVAPGLYHKERKMGLLVIPAIVFLFLAGVGCGYVALEPVLGFFMEQGVGFDTQISLNHYISFMVNFILAFGFAFQLPVLVTGLTAIGIVKPRVLREKRPYIHVALAALAAVLMPGDIATMVVLWVPLSGLFEMTMLAIKIFKIGEQHWVDGVTE